MQGEIIPVFRDHLLSTNAGFSAVVTSCSFTLMGNTVVLSATVVNTAAVTTLTFDLQGSMDEQAWQNIASFNQNTFGYNQVAAAAVQFPMLRVRVTLTGTAATARFDASLAMTQQ